MEISCSRLYRNFDPDLAMTVWTCPVTCTLDSVKTGIKLDQATYNCGFIGGISLLALYPASLRLPTNGASDLSTLVSAPVS